MYIHTYVRTLFDIGPGPKGHTEQNSTSEGGEGRGQAEEKGGHMSCLLGH